jgi:hypothetical protein
MSWRLLLLPRPPLQLPERIDDANVGLALNYELPKRQLGCLEAIEHWMTELVPLVSVVAIVMTTTCDLAPLAVVLAYEGIGVAAIDGDNDFPSLFIKSLLLY